jgi:hypothetical protein
VPELTRVNPAPSLFFHRPARPTNEATLGKAAGPKVGAGLAGTATARRGVACTATLGLYPGCAQTERSGTWLELGLGLGLAWLGLGLGLRLG